MTFALAILTCCSVSRACDGVPVRTARAPKPRSLTFVRFDSAKVPNATQTTVTGLKWFKIWEDGLDVSAQTWGVDRLIAAKGKVSFTIPSCIAAGQYLMRVSLPGLNQILISNAVLSQVEIIGRLRSP